MNSEIELISDGEGLAVIGEAAEVERFLVSKGLPSRELNLHRLGTALRTGSEVARLGSEVAANSGRWVKLTKESAQIMHDYGLMATKTPGVSHAMVGRPGSITKWLQIDSKAGTVLTNPAILAGAAGIMTQIAMQQTMDEITDYLAVIDEKVDDLLRAQKDAVLADAIGVNLVVGEAMTIREQVGSVSDVTWSKIQGAVATLARTQAYALLQLDALAEKLERKTSAGDLAKGVKDTESRVKEWLAALARCFQLQDAISVLELDRVLDTSPEDLDQHRLALKIAREKRLELISKSTEHLIDRMQAVTRTANTKVVLHPLASREIVESSNRIANGIVDFQRILGIERDSEAWKAKRWMEALVEIRDDALERGVDGVGAARRIGDEGLGRALTMGSKASSSLTDRLERAIAGRTAKSDKDGQSDNSRGALEGSASDDAGVNGVLTRNGEERAKE